MSINNIPVWLIQGLQISKHHKEISRLSGENFNIFKMLKLETKEVRLHSSFLAEFLNPKGTHGQGDLYLNLFIEIIRKRKHKEEKISHFHVKSTTVEIEKYIGKINEDKTEGGRIDILLTDENSQHIIIENKIYAGDQNKQLLRYHNFDKNALILYLTLEGAKPSEESTDNQVNKSHYLAISYENEIIQWLEACKKESVSLPIIRETLSQYINLLKHLTKQTVEDTMSKEIEELIYNNPDYVESIELFSGVLDNIVKDTTKKFKNKIDELFDDSSLLEFKDISLQPSQGEDCDGLYFGYTLEKGGEEFPHKKLGNYLRKKLKSILMELNIEIFGTQPCDYWFHLAPFKPKEKFKDFDKKEIIKMHEDENYLIGFIDKLIAQEKEIRKKFLATIDEKEFASLTQNQTKKKAFPISGL
jgi:hypothetical protein